MAGCQASFMSDTSTAKTGLDLRSVIGWVNVAGTIEKVCVHLLTPLMVLE